MADTGNKSDRTSKASFFTGVKTEFHKIIWPSRKTLGKQAVAVVTVSLVLGLIITFIDTILQYGINFLVK